MTSKVARDRSRGYGLRLPEVVGLALEKEAKRRGQKPGQMLRYMVMHQTWARQALRKAEIDVQED